MGRSSGRAGAQARSGSGDWGLGTPVAGAWRGENGGAGGAGASETDGQREYNRTREYLEKSVESLKRKLNKNMELHRSDNMRMMQENVTLVKEINDLRREIKQMKMKTTELKTFAI